MKISVSTLAQAIKVSRSRVNDIVLSRRRITADTAFRLARYFGTSPEYWINFQGRFGLDGRTESFAAVSSGRLRLAPRQAAWNKTTTRWSA